MTDRRDEAAERMRRHIDRETDDALQPAADPAFEEDIARAERTSAADEAAQPESATGDGPTQTAHPAGVEHAAANVENEPPG